MHEKRAMNFDLFWSQKSFYYLACLMEIVVELSSSKALAFPAANEFNSDCPDSEKFELALIAPQKCRTDRDCQIETDGAFCWAKTNECCRFKGLSWNESITANDILNFKASPKPTQFASSCSDNAGCKFPNAVCWTWLKGEEGTCYCAEDFQFDGRDCLPTKARSAEQITSKSYSTSLGQTTLSVKQIHSPTPATTSANVSVSTLRTQPETPVKIVQNNDAPKCDSVRGEGRHGNPSDCLAFFYAGADEQLDCCWTAGENSSIAPPLTGFVRLNDGEDM